MATRNTLSEQIRSQAFRNWFGGSYLADEQGRPMVLYHGTRPGNEFTEFRLSNEHDGIYFTPDPLYAEGFTGRLFSDEKDAGSIIPVFLSIQNPFVVVADPEDDDWEDFVYHGFDRKELIEQGYDGAVLIVKSSNEIDQIQAFYPEQIKSAIGNNGTFDPVTPDIRYSRNDPRYMFAGPQAETSDLLLFERARKLEKRQIPKEHIWRETGWMRGVDGNWRYEINDAEASLKIGIPDWLQQDVAARVDRGVVVREDGVLFKAVYREGQEGHIAGFGHSRNEAVANLKTHLARQEFSGIESIDRMGSSFFELHELLDHPRLFAAYPRLREMMVQFDPDTPDSEGGSFSHEQGITLNPRRTHGQILEILLHEIQHGIQEAEGFAYGGQPEDRFAQGMKRGLADLSDRQRRQLDTWADHHGSKLSAELCASEMITYGLMYQSMQRLISYANRDRPSGVLRLIRGEMSWAYHDVVRNSDVAREFDDLDRNWYAMPKRHKMQARNLFLREQCAEGARLLSDIIPIEVQKDFRQDDRQLKSILKSLDRTASRAREATAPYRELQRQKETAETLRDRHRFSTTFEIYKSLAGEIEARNTEARRTLSDDDRRAKMPQRTADVPDEDAIVIFRDRRSYELQVPYRTASASVAPVTRTRYSSAGGLDRDYAQHICNQLMEGWAGKPPIHAVNRISELPMSLQKDIYRKRAVEDVRAAFYNDAVYVIAPRLPNRDSLEEVLLHEIIGHSGLRSMLGEDFEATLEQVYTSMANTPLAGRIQATYFQEQVFNPRDPDHRQLVAEEIMAHLAESGEYRDLTDTARYETEVRSGLRNLGFELPLTHSDILALLAGAEDVVKNGGIATPGPANTCFRRAYHGSPYQFDRFSLDAIGTGEGAQAYGYGLYFAGHKGVAQWYSRVLGKSQVAVNGIEIPNVIGGHVSRDALAQAIRETTGASERQASNMVRLFNIGDQDFSTQAVRAELEQRIVDYRDVGADLAADQMEALRPFVAKLIVEPVRPGNLYEVDIPDDADLLDYDAPLSEHSASVRDALFASPLIGRQSNGWRGAPEGLFERNMLDRTGADIYRDLVSRFGNQRDASLHLESLGIPGMRYLDGDSRMECDGTHNYVIWNEPVVSIQAVNDQQVQANIQEYSQKRKHAGWKPERVDALVREYSYPASQASKAAMTAMNPTDFLRATTPNALYANSVREHSEPMDIERMASEPQPIYLNVRHDGGNQYKILSHEGRHRMAAFEQAGIESVPVVLRLHNEAGQPHSMTLALQFGPIHFEGQDYHDFLEGGHPCEGDPVTGEGLLLLSPGNHSVLKNWINTHSEPAMRFSRIAPENRPNRYRPDVPGMPSAMVRFTFEALGVPRTTVESWSDSKAHDLAEKAVFIYRSMVVGQLAEFDQIAPVDSPSQFLTEAWVDTHASHFEHHAHCAHSANLSHAELAEQYRHDLAQAGVAVDAQAAQRLSDFFKEVPNFLNRAMLQTGIIAQRAKRARESWDLGARPFGGRPSPAPSSSHWSVRAKRGAVEGLRFTKNHCPAPSIATWAALALTRQSQVQSTGELSASSQLASAVSIGLPILSALPKHFPNSTDASSHPDDLLIKHYPFMRDVIIDALEEVRSHPDTHATFSQVVTVSDTESQGALRHYLHELGYEDLLTPPLGSAEQLARPPESSGPSLH